MHVSLKLGAAHLGLLTVGIVISGCQLPFEEVYCSAASTPYPCLPPPPRLDPTAGECNLS